MSSIARLSGPSRPRLHDALYREAVMRVSRSLRLPIVPLLIQVACPRIPRHGGNTAALAQFRPRRGRYPIPSQSLR